MKIENFVDALVDYFEKKTGLTMSFINSEEDILLCDSLEAFMGKYYEYDECVFGISYLREDGFDSIVVLLVDKDSEDIQCWKEVVIDTHILDIDSSKLSKGNMMIDETIAIMKKDYT